MIDILPLVLSILATACLAYGLTYRYAPAWPLWARRAAWVISSLIVAFWLFLIFSQLFIFGGIQLLVIQLRSYRALEWTQPLLGVFAALLQRASNSRKMPKGAFRRHNGLVLILFLILPVYCNSLLFPCHPRWKQDWKNGVCHQSERYTCAAAATATVLKLLDREASEEAVSRQIRMTTRGAYCWDVLRLLRKEGVHPRLVGVPVQPRDLPVPCLAVVNLGGQGGISHMMCMLGETDKTFVIGDPLGGRYEWSKEKTWKHYYFTGIVIAVAR